MTRRRSLLLAGVVAMAALALIGYRQLGNTTTPVTVDEAVDRFEASAGETTTTIPPAPTTSNGVSPATPDPGPAPVPPALLPLPAPGVYPMVIEGEERIDLLTGASHTYPGTGFLTVTATACGVDLRWDFIAERWQSWSLCRGADGPELRGEQIFHSFFGQDDLVDRLCTDSPVGPAAERWTCEGGGSIAVRTVEVDAAVREVADFGAREVLVLRSELLEGDQPGNVEAIELWWDLETGLPLLEERTYDFTLETPLGDAAYDEFYTATLGSFDPVTAP